MTKEHADLEPEPEPLAPCARRGSMTLQEAMDYGLISKSEYEWHMDKYLKDTFGVSSDKELAELKRQHRDARLQGHGTYRAATTTGKKKAYLLSEIIEKTKTWNGAAGFDVKSKLEDASSGDKLQSRGICML